MWKQMKYLFYLLKQEALFFFNAGVNNEYNSSQKMGLKYQLLDI